MMGLVGILLGLVIGAGCRWFDLPLPAPPKLVGAVLVVMMTLGFLVTDNVVRSKDQSGELSNVVAGEEPDR